MKKFAFAFAAVAMAGTITTLATAPASASTGATSTVTIDTASYDLRSAQGYSLLTNHIERASERVCGTLDGRNVASAQNIRSCQDDAVSDAMAQLHNIARSPTVTVGSR